jgi:hypothetical protein
MPRERWEYRQVGVVLPIAQVRAMFAQARRRDARHGGRFSVSESTIGVGASANPHSWVGRLCVWWEAPTLTQAVIWQVAWNRAFSDAKRELLDAIAQLLGHPRLEDLPAMRALLQLQPAEEQAGPMPLPVEPAVDDDNREEAAKEENGCEYEYERRQGFPVYEHAPGTG